MEAVNTTENTEVDNTPAETSTPPIATTTVANAPEATQKSSEVKGYWAEDWRQRLAGDDEKELKHLQRYGSPEDIWKKARALEQRLTSGELKSAIPKNAGAEELKAWRAENGIPESPDQYKIDLGKGRDVAEEDKEIVSYILKNAHETNQTNEQVNASVRALESIRQAINEKQHEQDLYLKTQAEETLRSEWGNEFRRDINLITGLLDRTGGKELKDKFLNGRLQDGTQIGSSPEALKMLLSLALIDNPTGTVVPNAGGNLSQSVDDEIKKIEKAMAENRTVYNKDEAMQERYRELIDARENLKSRK